MFKLETRLIKQLLNSPETGMGYQRVEVTTSRNEERRGVVYNADLLLLEGESRAHLRGMAHETLLKSAARSEGQIVELRVSPAVSQTRAVKEMAATAGGEAKDAPTGMTTAAEAFKRFSAYANDRRVQQDGSLLPGTFATTDTDAMNVKTGTQAVARYALPNPRPASNACTSRPHATTPVQRGTAAPAYSQPGGGVEVIFPRGTQPSTTTGPITIPN